MSEMKNILELRATLLAIIDQRRTETGDPDLGANVERMILEEGLRELESDIMSNPGALEGQFVLLRRKRM